MRRACYVILFSLALAGLAMPIASEAQVICTGDASPPPELPVYEQPPIPAPGYLWAPGYWGIGPVGYYWVPGTWVLPPAVGLLWTPGYWAWRDGIYVWNAGYWGPHVGFYGGVNYGFGYGGVGYEGGRWDHGVFAYNRTVNNFGNVAITHVYEKTVVVEPGTSRVSFNGGSGGTTARPTPEEQAVVHEQHVAAVPSQLQHERTASENKALLASENHGKPTIAATAKPGEFTGKGVVAAREAPGPALPGVGAKNPGPIGTNPTAAKTLEERGTSTGPSGMSPGGAKSATNPTAAKTLEERGMSIGPSGTTPGAGKPATSPTAGAKKFEEQGMRTGPSGSIPSGVGMSNQKGMGGERATLNGGNAPRMLNTAPPSLQPMPHPGGPAHLQAGAPPLQAMPHPAGPPHLQAGVPPPQAVPHAGGPAHLQAGALPLQTMPRPGGPARPQGGGGRQQNNKDKDH